MALVGINPFDSLASFQEQLDRFFGRPLSELGLSGSNVFPPLNVFTDKDGWVIRGEVPGLSAEQVSIEVQPRLLTISGERPAPTTEKASIHRRERRFGKFARSVQLPADLDVEKAEAEIKNGLLTVRIPKAEAARPRLVSVKAA